MLAIDADSHFVEPLDLFERRIDARFRDHAYKVKNDPATGRRQLVVDNKPFRLLPARGGRTRERILNEITAISGARTL